MIATVANLFNDKQDNIRGKVVAVYLLLFISSAADTPSTPIISRRSTT
jgi:hypothetical protein